MASEQHEYQDVSGGEEEQAEERPDQGGRESSSLNEQGDVEQVAAKEEEDPYSRWMSLKRDDARPEDANDNSDAVPNQISEQQEQQEQEQREEKEKEKEQQQQQQQQLEKELDDNIKSDVPVAMEEEDGYSRADGRLAGRTRRTSTPVAIDGPRVFEHEGADHDSDHHSSHGAGNDEEARDDSTPLEVENSSDEEAPAVPPKRASKAHVRVDPKQRPLPAVPTTAASEPKVDWTAANATFDLDSDDCAEASDDDARYGGAAHSHGGDGHRDDDADADDDDDDLRLAHGEEQYEPPQNLQHCGQQQQQQQQQPSGRADGAGRGARAGTSHRSKSTRHMTKAQPPAHSVWTLTPFEEEAFLQLPHPDPKIELLPSTVCTSQFNRCPA